MPYEIQMDNPVIIIGAFHEVIELVESNKIPIYGLVDDKKKLHYRGYKILLNDADGSVLPIEYRSNPLIISPDQPYVRNRLFDRYNHLGFKFFSVISKRAIISKSAIIGNGVIIQDLVNISAEAEIGDFVKLNSICNIMHNATIDNFTTIAPNAVILGNVKIGKGCYIGSNATVLPNLTICDDAIIGAGAVVTKSISTPGRYIGIPAKMIE